jgi:AraC family transcriptional regulator
MTALTPHRYVIERRIERARQLLEQCELSIATIAVDTGFASQSHLTEFFRRSVGVTPAVYRADHSSSIAGVEVVTSGA